MRILLIDDEVMLTDALSYIFKKNGFSIDVANDGNTGFDLAETEIYDVIILDVMLPQKDGMSILRDLRSKNITTPIIMLTAKNSVTNKIEGLNEGADDYLGKPFSTDELLARVKALARRKAKELLSNDLKVKELCLMPNECELKIKDLTIKLTLKETQIIEMLMENFNRTVTREQLLDKIWGFDKDVEVNNIEAHICYLRKKINFKLAGLRLVTIRGIGYSLKE